MKRREMVYNFIVEYIGKYGYPPSLREITTGVGLRTTSATHNHLVNLEKAGKIKRAPRQARAIEVL